MEILGRGGNSRNSFWPMDRRSSVADRQEMALGYPAAGAVPTYRPRESMCPPYLYATWELAICLQISCHASPVPFRRPRHSLPQHSSWSKLLERSSRHFIEAESVSILKLSLISRIRECRYKNQSLIDIRALLSPFAMLSTINYPFILGTRAARRLWKSLECTCTRLACLINYCEILFIHLSLMAICCIHSDRFQDHPIQKQAFGPSRTQLFSKQSLTCFWLCSRKQKQPSPSVFCSVNEQNRERQHQIRNRGRNSADIAHWDTGFLCAWVRLYV